MTAYIVLFVIVVAMIDIILTGALAKWAILAPVFVPLFMRLGGDPNLVLAAYRVGDSPMNVITPLNVYLAVMVGFAQKYQKDAGIGTIVALMLPYTVDAAGALDADAGCVVRLRHPAGTGITAKVAFVRGMKLEACETGRKAYWDDPPQPLPVLPDQPRDHPPGGDDVRAVPTDAR